MKNEIETSLPVGSDALVLPLPGFTPGPWKWVGTQGNPGKYCYLHGEDHEQVGVSFDGFTANKANAELIAAAPDLLAACQEALFRTPPGSQIGPMLRAAIDKALGLSGQNAEPIDRPS
jgi:hypothetical protein